MRTPLAIVAVLAGLLVGAAGEAAEPKSDTDLIEYVSSRLTGQMEVTEPPPIQELRKPPSVRPSDEGPDSSLSPPERQSRHPDQVGEILLPANTLNEAPLNPELSKKMTEAPASPCSSYCSFGLDGFLGAVKLHDPIPYTFNSIFPLAGDIRSNPAFQFQPAAGSSSNGTPPTSFFTNITPVAPVAGSSSTSANGSIAGGGLSLAYLWPAGLGFLVEGSYLSGGSAQNNDQRTLTSMRLALLSVVEYNHYCFTFLGGFRYFSTTFDFLSPQQSLSVPVTSLTGVALGTFNESLRLPMSTDYSLPGGEFGVDVNSPYSSQGFSLFCRARLAVLKASRVLTVMSQPFADTSFFTNDLSTNVLALEMNLGVGVTWRPPAFASWTCQAQFLYQSIYLPGSAGSGSGFLLQGEMLQASLAYRF